MSQFIEQASEELEQGHDICLATIVNQIGSAPRALGTSFLVRADGSILGTIGGGRLEGEVIQAAIQALSRGHSRLLHFRLKGRDVAQSEMICGGDLDVYLEPLRAEDQAARVILAAAARVAARGGRALMVTPIQPGPLPGLEGRKLLLIPGEPPLGRLEARPGLAGELAPNLEDLIDQGRPALWMQASGTEAGPACLVEPIHSRPVVYLFGGGHISRYLARLIKMVDFRLVVADDRKEFANRERFPQADELWVGDFDNLLQGRQLGPEAYVVIVTRGHIFDKEVLAQVLTRPTAYLGMIGSRRKKALIFKALQDEGFSPRDLERVHAPIGLDIGAETPQEIAVCIVAQLIQVRAQRSGVKRPGW